MQAIATFIKNHKILTAFVVALVLIMAGAFLFRPEPTGFRVTSTNPGLNKVTYLTPFLKLTYSERIVYEKLSIPEQEVVKSYESSDKTLTIFLNLRPDQIGKTLTVKVLGVVSTTGSKLENQEYSFKVRDGNWDTLPEDQKAATLDEQDKKPPAYTDPILTSLPYETPTYRISALVTNKGETTDLKLRAELTPVFADTREDGSVDDAVINRYKQEVVDHIRSLNLDPARYDIEYVIINPYAAIGSSPSAR